MTIDLECKLFGPGCLDEIIPYTAPALLANRGES
jgi:hypothetical protein